MKTLDQMSGMPQIRAAFAGWTSTINLVTITQKVVDGLVEEKQQNISFTGVIQPLNAKSLYLKPEGQRSFQWYQIHCISGSLNLDVNDRIQYNGKFYKIMNVWNWDLDNYVEYHAIQDYESRGING